MESPLRRHGKMGSVESGHGDLDMGGGMWTLAKGHRAPLLHGVTGPAACNLCALHPLTVGLLMLVVWDWLDSTAQSSSVPRLPVQNLVRV